MTTQTLQAIQTEYKGYKFRSRLEARWAVFFDDLGVRWDYEPEGFDLGPDGGWYLPDFYLPDQEWWIECKAVRPSEPEELKGSLLSKQSGKQVYFLVGTPGDEKGMTIPVDWREDKTILVPVESGMIKPRRLFAGERDFHSGIEVLCPVCDFNYVHFSQPKFIATDDGKAWAGRGSAIRIPMYCESGHHWEARLGFHKGNTFFDIEQVYEEIHGFDILYKGNKKLLDHAIAASRSARFEHGESGAT